MNECLTNTISEATDLYIIHRGINKKKYFSRYLNIGKYVWQDIFQKTLWVVNSVWEPLRQEGDRFYINIPPNAQTVFSVGVVDHCDLIQPLYYNNQINVVAKPKESGCGCNKCDCAGLCQATNSLQVTTKLIFTINGVNYYQKCWVEYCKNGDVLEWCEIPTKKYNSIVGDGGDFNNDYNNDYLIGAAPFSDYTIEIVKTQKKLCKLEVKECGCPVETEENNELFLNCCGFYMDWSCQNKNRHCKEFFENVNNNHYGEVKLSDCGTKMYYRPSKKWQQVTGQKMPKHLLVNFQTNGQYVGQEIQIPTYANMCYWAGLDYRSKVFNDRYSMGEKKIAEYKYNDEKALVISYLNPIDIVFMASVQNLSIIW